MLSRTFRSSFSRYLHNKTPSKPELDFTKPISDRLKKTSSSSSSSQIQSDFHDQSILKIPLRGQCLFGLYPIELALQSKRRQFYRLFFSHTSNDNRQLIQTIQTLAKELSIPIEYTNTHTLDRLSFDRPHQGVCLDCSSLPIEEIEHVELQNNPQKISLDLCLVKIHDPMNLGAMIRSAHFFGIDRMILTRGTCQPSPVASKASSGALELSSIYSCQDLKTYLELLHTQKSIAIIGATHQGDVSLQTLNVNDIKNRFANLERILLLIGNEHEGITEEISQLCHYNVCIQSNTASKISSLNASVACALFLYHISAQMNM